jgi:hypothetical protein
MSYVITLPEALAAAAGQLRGIGSALAAQNAAAAAPTTGVVPAAADEVSALQATQFSAYGSLYQAVSAQATAIHEMFVATLGASGESYAAAEAANVAAASSGSGLSLPGLLTGQGAYGLVPSALSNSAIIGAMQAGNFGSAASDLIQVSPASSTAAGTSGTAAMAAAAADSAGVGEAVAAGNAQPPGAVGAGAAPVLASAGQAPAVGRLSVPPSWAGEATSVSSGTPARLSGTGWTTATSESAPVATVPAGLPSVAAAGKPAGFGAPRYGVKPTVMARPAVV